MVAHVSNSGGLGIFATARCTTGEMRENIRAIRKMTGKPFGVNVIVGPGSEEKIKVAIEEKVPVFNYTLGKPWFIDQVHSYGSKVIGTTAKVAHAIKAAELGCDAVVITGHEAAAHGDKATSLVLTPITASSIRVPVISAGGIYDGRGLAAALSLGAEGVSMGTRFMLTKECILHDNFKILCLDATEQDTIYDTVFDGMWGRTLKSKGAESMLRRGVSTFERFRAAMNIRKVLKMSHSSFISMGMRTMVGGQDASSLWAQSHQAVGAVKSMKAIYDGDTNNGILFAGQNIGGIRDIPTINDLINRIVSEAEQVINYLQKKVG
jgi:enoyl-[acyl-carrier protein] reductase II